MKQNNQEMINESLACIRQSGDSIILHIRVSPNASQSKLIGFYADELKIAVKAPPVDGAANKELIRFLSKLFAIPKSSLNLIRGEASRSKQVSIDGMNLNNITAIIKENSE